MTSTSLAARPIPTLDDPVWHEIARLPIVDNDEPLVPLNLAPERIHVRPAYYLDGVPGAVPECHARASVQERLMDAASRLPPRLRLVILDAWRPYAVQRHLSETLHRVLRRECPELTGMALQRRVREFVAPPSRDPAAPSPHLTGGAVDVTLSDDQGRLLPMGSMFDEITPRSHTRYLETATAEGCLQARGHRRMLYHTMTAAGFTNLPTEWWHFDFGDQLWAWVRGAPQACYGIAGFETLEARWTAQIHTCRASSPSG